MTLIININVMIYNILVHCKRGHHRSGAIIASFLIKYLHLDYDSAVKYINYLRPYAMRRETNMSKHLYAYHLLISNR